MEMHWAASRWDSGSHFDGKGSDNHGKDEEEGGDRDRDEEDKDKEDEDEDKNKDEDEDSFYESEIPGVSNWDLLGKDFECKAAALGLFSSYKFPTKLTTLQMESLWENWTLVYFVNIHWKWRTTCQIAPSIDLLKLFWTWARTASKWSRNTSNLSLDFSLYATAAV